MIKTSLALITFLLLIQSAMANDTPACAASGDFNFICGPQNAEDFVLVPSSQWVLSSSMRLGGGIYLINSIDKTWGQLFSQKKKRVEHDKKTYTNCPGAPEPESLITHGLNIQPGKEGHSTLYTVGHGKREAIEVFDIDANKSVPELTWIGCILMPKDLAANSVASFKDGSLVTTVLMYPGKTHADFFAGNNTGAVYEWSPGDSGFQVIQGTELPGNNGIEISADEKEIFVVSTGLRTIVAFSRDNPSRRLRTTRTMDFYPDNLHMTDDGQLLAAGISSVPGICKESDTENELKPKFTTCPRGYVIGVIDPDTMKDTVPFSGPANSAFTNISMALFVGDEAWLGTYLGDRIAIINNQK
ncbi:MAG: hypothetical protein ACI95X_002322 [Paraglaciecola sp.]|jgi:hypothetical protein